MARRSASSTDVRWTRARWTPSDAASAPGSSTRRITEANTKGSRTLGRCQGRSGAMVAAWYHRAADGSSSAQVVGASQRPSAAWTGAGAVPPAEPCSRMLAAFTTSKASSSSESAPAAGAVATTSGAMPCPVIG